MTNNNHWLYEDLAQSDLYNPLDDNGYDNDGYGAVYAPMDMAAHLPEWADYTPTDADAPPEADPHTGEHLAYTLEPEQSARDANPAALAQNRDKHCPTGTDEPARYIPADEDVPPEPFRYTLTPNTLISHEPSLPNDQQHATPPYQAPVAHWYHPEPLPRYPVWVEEHKQGANTVNVWQFAQWFIEIYDVQYINYQFYIDSKHYTVKLLRNKLINEIEPYAEVTPQKLSNIVTLLEDRCVTEPPIMQPQAICFKNCTLALVSKGTPAAPHNTENATQRNALAAASEATNADAPVTPQTTATETQNTAKLRQTRDIILRKLPPVDTYPWRIPHNFNPKAGEPTALLAFLNQLFEPTDLLTVQEYLGYCMLPSTKAQKALFIIGKGGEGKSRLTVLMQLLLEDTAIVSSVAKIGEQFFGATLENRLLFIDDDLQTTKFSATDAFKTLVTNESKQLVENKYQPHHEIRTCARFLLIGNQSIGSLHDKSHGFYRRVHIINTRPAPKNRPNNPDLIHDIWDAEKDEIILWLVKGALRLARQNYYLTESDAAQEALVQLKEDDNTALSFLEEQSFIYGAQYSVTSGQLSRKYRDWCYDNDLFRMSGRSFKQMCDLYFEDKGVVYSKNIPTGTGLMRGFKGVGYCY